MLAFPCAHPTRLSVQRRAVVLRCSNHCHFSHLPGARWIPFPEGLQPLGAPCMPLPCGPAHFVFSSVHNRSRCTSSLACALCPFFPPARAGRDSALRPWRVEASVERDRRKMLRGDAGSTLLPGRGILITPMHGQLAEGAGSSPRVCVLVIYRQ